MRNAITATRRRSPTTLAICALLALAAVIALIAAVPAALPAQTTIVDYDVDNDGYIEVSTHAQLNVIRHDLDGNGDPTSGGATAYGTAFPNRITAASRRMGCPDGACVGYELTANINLDTNGDGSHTSADTYYDNGSGWDPIGTGTAGFSGDFKGNGFDVQNLTISRNTLAGVGLFARIESTSRIESVGITDANVTGGSYTGALIGSNWNGAIVACYSTGSVTAASTTSTGPAGGLVGWQGRSAAATITSSYSHASVSGIQHVGGLVGANEQSSRVINSYATGAITRSSGTATNIGGLIGSSGATATASYFNSTTSGCVTGGSAGCTTSAGGSGVTAQTTTQLQTPTGYTGIYAAWNINIDGLGGNDDPWNFGTSSAYPTLKYGSTEDYDADDDGYIEVRTLAQLNAIRYDLDANGAPTSGGATAYGTAFPRRTTAASNRMGCPSGACTGYELLVNLDFDTDGSGSVASGDSYYNSGSGWEPLGDSSTGYSGNFNGNRNTINNLFISRSTATEPVGLFGRIDSGARIELASITGASVTGGNYAGILSGYNYGAIIASYTTGSVTGGSYVGGLVAHSNATVSTSYSTASATGTSNVGGLIGYGDGSSGAITNSYSTGAVSRSSGSATSIGGLVGARASGFSATASYYDTTTSGCVSGGSNGCITSAVGVGQTTSALQTPGGYTGIYADWDIDLNNDGVDDAPWTFGSSSQYPTIVYPLADYDADNDGYIEVDSLAKLNAIRHDLDGNGDPSHAAAYDAAFPDRLDVASALMGCPAGACVGYELTANLDFDGAGWAPIGNTHNTYRGNFKGNGHTISNMVITSNSQNGSGLFGGIGGSARIETLGVINANVTAVRAVGIVVGWARNTSSIVACYSTGRVVSTEPSSHSGSAGGIAGWMEDNSSINSSYSTAHSEGNISIAGLVGRLEESSSVTNSYSTGRVIRTSGSNPSIRGLVGWLATNNGSINNSYWDTVTSGQTSSHNAPGGSSATATVTGKTPRELQAPTGYTGTIYSTWNIDLDGDGVVDDPWDFGNGMQYPMLKYNGMPTAPQGDQAIGIPDNWNTPVVGERINVRLSPEDFPNRAIVQGTQYREPWGWEKSANGGIWTDIPGTGDGTKLPTYEYSPTADDVGSYIRAKVKLDDGSFAHTRALGGRVIADTGAAISGTTAGAAIPFIDGHIAPYVGGAAEVVAANPLPAGAVDVRIGWQRCEDNIAPHSDCESVPGVWWIRYKPTAADAGKYLRMYAYYETAAGVWTRSVTDFTVGVVATVSP